MALDEIERSLAETEIAILQGHSTPWRCGQREVPTDLKEQHGRQFREPASATKKAGKSHESLRLDPVATSSGEPSSTGQAVAGQAETAESGTPAAIADRRTASRAAAGAAPRIKAREFDGCSGLEEYLVHFERVARINNWDESAMADYLLVSLKGQALEVACSLNKELQSNYAELVKVLDRRFGSERQRVRHRAELSTRRRRPGETVAELGQVIRKLVKRAYPDSGLAFQDEFAIEQFKNALDDYDLKQALFQGKPKTLDDAVEIVAEAEAWLKAEKVGRSRAVKTPVGERQDSQTCTETVDIAEMLRGVLTTLDQQKKTNAKDWKPGCWICGSLEHFRAGCPQATKKPPPLN